MKLNLGERVLAALGNPTMTDVQKKALEAGLERHALIVLGKTITVTLNLVYATVNVDNGAGATTETHPHPVVGTAEGVVTGSTDLDPLKTYINERQDDIKTRMGRIRENGTFTLNLGTNALASLGNPRYSAEQIGKIEAGLQQYALSALQKTLTVKVVLRYGDANGSADAADNAAADVMLADSASMPTLQPLVVAIALDEQTGEPLVTDKKPAPKDGASNAARVAIAKIKGKKSK